MKTAKQSNRGLVEIEDVGLSDYIVALDKDVESLFKLAQSRIRFGTASDGSQGENISGEYQLFTTSATPDAENTIAHTLGAIPIGYLIFYQDKAGDLYQGPTTGTNWSSTQIFLKCDVASVTFLIFLVK